MKSPLKVSLLVVASLFVGLGSRGLAADSETVERMRRIVHAHQQLYGGSCIPTAVELVLILAGRVPSSYYELQREWKAEQYGTFDRFIGRTIAGLTFQAKFRGPRFAMFPFKGLFAAIDAELDAERFVIIGLRDDDEGPFHAWVIVERLPDGEYRGFSKDGTLTMEATDIKSRIVRIGGTEIDTYREEEPNKPLQPTPGSVTPRAPESTSK